MKTVYLIWVTVLCLAVPGWATDFTEQVKTPVRKSIEIRQQTQQAEDKWVEEKASLEAQLQQLQLEHEALTARNNDLTRQIDSANGRIQTFERKINGISRISDELSPFMNDVLEQFASMVDTGLPFLSGERTRRIELLREVFDDPRTDTAEKFRRLMEALFIEASYGNTVEVYQEKINVDAATFLANIFRLGRLSLFFQTLDQKTSGYYDPALSRWQILPPAHNKTISDAIEIASKQRSIDLIDLPIGRIQTK